jgi:hypothetical protein
MKNSQLPGAVCVGIVMVLASFSANASIIYNLNRSIGAGTITGFIETDGTIGVLASANITDWVLTLSAPYLRGGTSDQIEFASATVSSITGSALSASATALTFDFSSSGNSYLYLQGNSSNYYGLETATGNLAVGTAAESIGRDSRFPNPTYTEFVSRSGSVDIAQAVVPVPPAVWLFGSGLLGLIGIARKKAA